jgi:hypothetical protein
MGFDFGPVTVLAVLAIQIRRLNRKGLARILHSSTETERSPMFTGSFRRTEKIALDSVSKRAAVPHEH